MRRLVAGLAVTVVFGTGGHAAYAETMPRITVTRTEGHVAVSMQKDRLTVTQTLTPRTFNLIVAQDGDRVRLAGDADGLVTVERNGTGYRFFVRGPGGIDTRAVQALFTGSAALHQFDRLMGSSWVRTEQRAWVFVASHA